MRIIRHNYEDVNLESIYEQYMKICEEGYHESRISKYNSLGDFVIIFERDEIRIRFHNHEGRFDCLYKVSLFNYYVETIKDTICTILEYFMEEQIKLINKERRLINADR